MTSQNKFLDREAVRSVIQQWNANRLDLFALSEPDDNLLFHGVMRFYFQDAGQKVATKCIRVASDATVADVIDTLIEKFRPDMRMLSVPNYALYEVHSNGEERKLSRDEKPLLVQLNWHIDDREGRFLLKNIDQKTTPIENTDTHFKRKFSKRQKKEQKKKEKLSRQNWESIRNTENEMHVADKLYTELPDTSFTRSISNPEAVMRRRRQQKLEKKLQQFRSKDGGPDTGGTLKIYGESLCQDVPYKTLLLSIRDCAQAVVREMLSKYGLDKTDPLQYCLVQVNCDSTEYILDDDECPLSILMNHPTSRGSIMFHVRRRPADAQPRRRKKKPLGASNGSNSASSCREGPILVEVTHSGDNGRRIKLGSDPIEVGSANTNSLQLFGPSIQARHCLISLLEEVCTVTPLHADALTFVNGHHITQPTILHNGSVVMFGRVASYRFLDSPSDGRFNLALSQSQLDSACLYEGRSPTLPELWSREDGNISTSQTVEVERGTNNTHTNIGLVDEYNKQITNRSTPKEQEIEPNYEATEQNLDSETKSISSFKSAESHNQDQRSQNKVSGLQNQGQELILPAVLEFPEKHQEQFLSQIVTELDVNLPQFKLAPVYSLYLCARYRASTHYRPELQPTERAHKLTIFLHHVANLIYSIIQGQYTNSRVLAFWMANSSEFLNFLKSDRHISAFSTKAQEILAESVQNAFHNLVNCFRVELAQTLNHQFLSETMDHDSAAGLVLTVLGSEMALLRRCRVNAALTIQLFSQLFHYISAMCFNTILAKSHMCTAEWGKVLAERLQLLELWAERQGLELAADCHLAKINQCAQFLQSPKTSVEEIQKLTCSCFRLNSLQMAALLQQEQISRNLIDTAIRMAESVADELTRADGREVRLEESLELNLVLLLPDDGFSCDVVRGIPSGLLDFLNPLQSAGICRLAAQPTSVGLWTVYMHQFNARSPSEMSNKLPQPEVQVIKLQKNLNGMGLSIVAAKGAGQEQLGIYIKSVVPGGAADADNRLQAGDQLLQVDGQSLVGITQERAAGYLVRTGPVVTLEVAKQGAIYHGLATLLQQPSPIIQRDNRSQKDGTIFEGDFKTNEQFSSNHSPSKSVPILHHSKKNISSFNSNPRIAQNSSNSNEQGFYQNLSAYRVQNQNQHVFGERLASTNSSTRNVSTGTHSKSIQKPTSPNTQQILTNQNIFVTRPTSSYYQANHIVISADNLGKSASSLSINLNGDSSTQQSNTKQYHQQPQTFLNIGNRSRSTQNFNKEEQSQNSLRMNQMLAPSMPNISDARTTSLSPHIYNTGLLSSQSMQNVAMIHQVASQADTQQSQYQLQRLHNSAQSQQQIPKNSACFQPSVEEKSIRRNHRTDSVQDVSNQKITHSNSQKNVQKQDQFCASVSISPPKPHDDKYNMSSSLKASSKQQNQPNIPNSQPIRAVQNYQKQLNTEEKPPLPPTTTHPLFKSNSQSSQGVNCVANSSEPQTGSYYPKNASLTHQGQFSAANPWEREEREKEQEIRREQIRIWRDSQITTLSNLPHRFPQQEEQLKTLVLEREFDRRVHEVEEQEEDSEPSLDKENIEDEKFRKQQILFQQSNSNLFQTDTEVKQVIGCLENREMNNKVSKTDSQVPLLQNAPSTTMPPKGILKNNRYDSSNFSIKISSTLTSKTSANTSDERQSYGEGDVNTISKNVSNLNLDINPNTLEHLVSGEYMSQSSSTLSKTSPPSPPERNISYVVMSQKQQPINNPNLSKHIFPSQIEAYNQYNNNDFLQSVPSQRLSDTQSFLNANANRSLLILGRDTKRVSFHDKENNCEPSLTPLPANTTSHSSNKMDNHSPCSLGEISQSPHTSEADLWNLTIKSTPGVIGAQEVYRDPRQRRLAEQHEKEQQRSGDAVPEKLSFKEKMKMFALESGEDQTPKDKLKISRAQRDIDASH